MFKSVNLLCLVQSYRDRIQGKLLINILIIVVVRKTATWRDRDLCWDWGEKWLVQGNPIGYSLNLYQKERDILKE